MKSKKGKTARRPVASRGTPAWAPYAAAAAIAVLVFLWAYSPVAHTEFVFDDTNQQFALPSAASAPLRAWIGPVRPVLMFSYWLNVQISGADTFSFHGLNLVIHGDRKSVV